MKVDLKELRKRKKFIREQKHDSLDLLIWNYTQACQFDKAWDEYTLMTRGLITDSKGDVKARPFDKFFNLNEDVATKIENLPGDKPKVHEKMDGSLGIQYYIDDVPFIATRGSFHSDQANFASEWIQKLKDKRFAEGYTYLYEIIYPDNRIVVDYGDKRELVLLAVINIDTGAELDISKEARRLNINHACTINTKLDKLIESMPTLDANEEGYVVRYKNGLRIKMKGDEYLRLHRLITQFSNRTVWDLLRNDQPFDEFLYRVPDEFYNWIKETKNDLESAYLLTEGVCQNMLKDVCNLETRKEQAGFIMQHFKGFASVLFLMLDKRDYKQRIWRMLKPKFAKPFREET